jgi:hypothetical protein
LGSLRVGGEWGVEQGLGRRIGIVIMGTIGVEDEILQDTSSDAAESEIELLPLVVEL